MAKQHKKGQARRAPRASEPRMYGDGAPSQQAQAQPPATSTTASTAAPARTTASRAVPRGSGAAGSYARVDRIADYTYVMSDLRRLGITAAAILAGLIVLGFIVH